MKINLTPDPNRRCGDCQLCCRLLPIKDGHLIDGRPTPGFFHKPANTKCKHQKFGVGCAIYSRRPFACQAFSCRWLTNEDTADQQRPDRAHCVIDPMPDAIEIMDNDTGIQSSIQVLQIWVDPRHRYAYREEPMRSYIERQGKQGLASLIRWSSSEGVVVFPASITGNVWQERGGTSTGQSNILDVMKAERLTPP
jgi:hypothetical protein